MIINSERFGSIELDDASAIQIPSGIIGFPKERRYALIPHGSTGAVAWLQSLDNPALAFPLVSAHALPMDYPGMDISAAAAACGITANADDLAVLVVLSAATGLPATVNLLAPIVIDTRTRQGAQILLEGTAFSTREMFRMRPANQVTAEGATEAEAARDAAE